MPCMLQLLQKAVMDNDMQEVSLLVDKITRGYAIVPLTELSSDMYISSMERHHRTIMFIDLKNFTERCAVSPVAGVGEWMSAFYHNTNRIAKVHVVKVMEWRGDCCICMSDALQCNEKPADHLFMVTRMLAFACDMFNALRNVEQPRRDMSNHNIFKSTTCRMGMASGDVSVLMDNKGIFSAVQGDVVNMAARLESMSEDGRVMVHSSSLHYLALERKVIHNVHLPTHLQCVFKGKGLQDYAIYDLAKPSWRCSANDDISVPFTPVVHEPKSDGVIRRTAAPRRTVPLSKILLKKLLMKRHNSPAIDDASLAFEI